MAPVSWFWMRWRNSHKLAKDGTLFGPGQAVITPALARAELIQLFGEWETQGLTQSRAQFEKELFVEINANDPHRLDTNLSPHLLGKFLTGAFLLSFRLWAPPLTFYHSPVTRASRAPHPTL